MGSPYRLRDGRVQTCRRANDPMELVVAAVKHELPGLKSWD